MNVYHKPETDINLCTELDCLMQVRTSLTRIIVEPGNAVNPWDPNAGLSEFNSIWDEEDEEDNNLNKLKNK